MDTHKNNGWLSGTKKLLSTISTEVSQIFSADSNPNQYPTNEEIERRVGSSGIPAQSDFLGQFDAQLRKELNQSNSASSPVRRPPDTPSQLRYSHSHPNSFTNLPSFPSSSSPSPTHTMKTSWNAHEASDMGLMPSIPTYQQQILQNTSLGQDHINDANNQNNYYNATTATTAAPMPNDINNINTTSNPSYLATPPTATYTTPYNNSPIPLGASNTPYNTPTHPVSLPRTGDAYSAPPANYTQAQPFNSSSPYVQPTPLLPANSTHPYFNTSLPNNMTNSTGFSSSPTPSIGYPASSGQQLQQLGYTAPSTLNQTYPPQTAALPYLAPIPLSPVSPRSPPLHGSYVSSSIPLPAAASYTGPSFTSSAYSSGTAGSLPPPPPPSSYWMQRAAQQQAAGPSNRIEDGAAVSAVDYSDLDPKSMDFAYAWKEKQPPTQ